MKKKRQTFTVKGEKTSTNRQEVGTSPEGGRKDDVMIRRIKKVLLCPIDPFISHHLAARVAETRLASMRHRMLMPALWAFINRKTHKIIILLDTHGDYSRYLWIINGPSPYNNFGSGPFQLVLSSGLFLSEFF